jgi:two-component system sensor histidine kinase BaeS
VRGNDELAQLGTAFNDMAGSIATADKQRRRLVSDVAHELRNPLTIVRGYLEAAQDGVVPVDTALIDTLLAETSHLGHLVDDLQDVALAEAGQLRLAVEPVELDDLLTNVVGAAGGAARRGGVELTADVGPGSIVAGDAVRLRQVFANLVDNALRHTPVNGTVRVVAAPAPDGSVHVSVADTGEGIAAEHLTRIFDRFYRTDDSRTRGSGGSGLGLAICKHLVEAHGGTIAVTSRPGHGTAFTVTLPRAAGVGTQAAAATGAGQGAIN